MNPHITIQLAGTELKYDYQGQKLIIALDMNRYAVSNDRFKITSDKHFGFYAVSNQLSYFTGDKATASLVAKTDATSKLALDVKIWSAVEMGWTQTSTNKGDRKLTYTINQLIPNTYFTITINGKARPPVKSNANGSVIFNHKTSTTADHVIISKG